ncbi:MAG: GTP cyclohydrolase I FolE2 [Candidatus Eremiobacteraeota bacterium]|nr:GTP cyclohydrolase I FolE2 [Candidatus Eremiobacteraeota bacterium]
MHTVYLGIGSNLGDRQSNILNALQRLRRRCSVDAVSAFYETPPMGGVEGPAFLNVAVRLSTILEPQALEHFLREVEYGVGRQRMTPASARPIDIDLLAFDDLREDFGRFEVPHPYLSERPYNLVPLAEIAPNLREPRSGQTIAELAAAVRQAGIVRRERSLHFNANRQDEEPEVRLSIDRAGTTKLRRVVHLVVDGRARTFNGEFSMLADLPKDKSGVHMSRFTEALEEAALDVLARDASPAPIEDVVATIAREIVNTQRALRADVRLDAEFALERWTPVSGKRGEETYRLIGIAHAENGSVRRAVGVEAQGMTACPCAQLMVREHSRRELVAAGFSADDAERALDALPIATHNQRGRGTVLIGIPDEQRSVRAEDLVEIVENSMSSETYDLLKRPDEFFVVNKAHHNPKFVEDVVRGIAARALTMYDDFPDETFLAAAHVNDESIHKHDAFAEAYGTFGELREELRGAEASYARTDLAGWLGTRRSLAVTGSW